MGEPGGEAGELLRGTILKANEAYFSNRQATCGPGSPFCKRRGSGTRDRKSPVLSLCLLIRRHGSHDSPLESERLVFGAVLGKSYLSLIFSIC